MDLLRFQQIRFLFFHMTCAGGQTRRDCAVVCGCSLPGAKGRSARSPSAVSTIVAAHERGNAWQSIGRVGFARKTV